MQILAGEAGRKLSQASHADHMGSASQPCSFPGIVGPGRYPMVTCHITTSGKSASDCSKDTDPSKRWCEKGKEIDGFSAGRCSKWAFHISGRIIAYMVVWWRARKRNDVGNIS